MGFPMKFSKVVLASSALSLAFFVASCSSTKKAEPAKEQAKPAETAPAEPAARLLLKIQNLLLC